MKSIFKIEEMIVGFVENTQFSSVKRGFPPFERLPFMTFPDKTSRYIFSMTKVLKQYGSIVEDSVSRL